MFDSNFCVLGIGYEKRSGKDTMADYLVKNYGFTKMSFADPLKEAARIIFCLDNEQLYGDLKEVIDPRWDKTPRELLQKLGTEAVRDQIDREAWTKNMGLRIQDHVTKHSNLRIVIPDMRFSNEVRFIKSISGGMAIKVNRPGLIKNEFSAHASENELDSYQSFDAVLQNDKALQDFYNTIDQFMGRFE